MSRTSLAIIGAALAASCALNRVPARADAPPAWQLSLRPAKAGAVFDVGEPAVVPATVRNVAGVVTQAKLSFTVQDYDGKTLGAGEAAVEVPKGEVRAVELRLGDSGKLPTGRYLAMVVRLEADGKQQAEVRKGFGFLPARTVTTPPATSPFGLLAEYNWPLVRNLGARYVRPNWSWDERPMDWAKRYGIACCPLINEANAYARGDLTEKQYADFVYDSVSRYKSYVKYWQLGNEFDIFHRDGPRSYVDSQRIGYAAAKRADPTCIVIGGSITELQCRKEGWAEALQLGLARYCDIYDFHFYQDPKTTQQMLDYIHQTCRQYKAEKPLWVTETTQYGMFDPDDRNQAEYIFRRYAHLMANGVSVVFWHCFRWPYPFEADKTAATGILDHDGFARPSVFAFAAMTKALEGSRFVKRWDAGIDTWVLEFARGIETRLVLWNDGTPRQVTARCSPGKASRVLVDGREENLAGFDGKLQTEVTKTPVIYCLPGRITGVE